MIETVAEHSFQTLQPKSKILDIGCLGFLFTDEMRRRGHSVCAIDIQDLEGDYVKVAITDYNGFAVIVPSNDKQAFKIKRSDKDGDVQCMTLDHFSSGRFWDLIKIDVEGSELEIIDSLDQPPARQLSIEFHLHTGVYSMGAVEDMVWKLHSLGYKTAKHDYTAAHGCGHNFWDSLFVL